jgi:TM2 domain-containing membrane protein YozV
MTLRLRLRPRTDIASVLAWPDRIGRAAWQFIAFFVGLVTVTDYSGAALIALLIWAPELRLFGNRQQLYLYGVNACDIERFRFWSVLLSIFVPGVIGGLVGLALVGWTADSIEAASLLYGLLLLRLGMAGFGKLLRPFPGAALATTIAAFTLWFTVLSERVDIVGLICAVAGVIGIVTSLRIRTESELRAEMRAGHWNQVDSRQFLS